MDDSIQVHFFLWILRLSIYLKGRGTERAERERSYIGVSAGNGATGIPTWCLYKLMVLQVEA